MGPGKVSHHTQASICKTLQHMFSEISNIKLYMTCVTSVYNQQMLDIGGSTLVSFPDTPPRGIWE